MFSSYGVLRVLGRGARQDEKDVTPEWLTAALHENATIPATVKVRAPRDGGPRNGSAAGSWSGAAP